MNENCPTCGCEYCYDNETSCSKRIAELEGEIKAAIPHSQERRYEMDRLQAANERLRAAILDFFVHDKRETRTALRDLVGGFAGVDKHKAALSEDEG